MEKVCRTCRERKPLKAFYTSKYHQAGVTSRCKECIKAYQRHYNKNNKEIIAVRASRYRQAHKEEISRKGKAYYEENKELLKSKARRRYWDIQLPQRLLNSARYRARQQGLVCTITLEDIRVPERCPILNVVLRPNTGKQSEDSPTLDRIDSKLGYVPGNVAVISWRANSLKSDASVEEVECLLAYMKGEL